MFKKDQEPSQLDAAITKAFDALDEETVGSDDYVKVAQQLTTLHKMKDENPNRISKDTLVLVGANLLGILLIIRHEHVNVITTRAMNLVPKLK
jgi:hypothetical protein